MGVPSELLREEELKIEAMKQKPMAHTNENWNKAKSKPKPKP